MTPTGIDYLRLVEAKHTAELADRLRYADLWRAFTLPDCGSNRVHFGKERY